jgi:hypothetical protein
LTAVDGAILDLNLSDGDVTPVAERLLANMVPVIVQTGGDLPHELRRRYPALVALSKPLIAEHLVQKMGRMLSAE